MKSNHEDSSAGPVEDAGNAPEVAKSTAKPALLSRAQLAKELNLSPRKVIYLTDNRTIPVLRIGTRRLYQLDRVMAALQRFEVPAIS